MPKEENAKTLLKLNLGCGLVAPVGWINIDSSYNARLAKYPEIRRLLRKFKIISETLSEIPWPKNISILDVRKGLPYPDNSAKFIYASHFLELIAEMQ